MSEQKVTALCLLDLSVPSILLIILFSIIASPLGLVLMAKLLLGLLLIYHLVALMFLSTIFPLLTLPFVKVFHKNQSLVLSYSYSILLLSVLLSLIRLSDIIYLLMTLNCSSPSGHLNSPPIFYTYKIQLIQSFNGCLLIFSHSISLKLSFFLLVYLLNYLKYLILLF